MDIKKWLSQYPVLRAEAYRLVEELDVHKEKQSPLGQAQFQNAERRLNECLVQIEEIDAAIASLKDHQERLILNYRYTSSTDAALRPWRDIAERVYGKDSESKMQMVHRIHKRALKNLKEVLQRK